MGAENRECTACSFAHFKYRRTLYTNPILDVSKHNRIPARNALAVSIMVYVRSVESSKTLSRPAMMNGEMARAVTIYRRARF